MEPRELQPRRIDPARWILYAVLLSLVVMVLGPSLWRPALEKRAIASLTVEQRGEAYRLALTTVQNVCLRDVGDALRRHCRQEAEFLSDCPECDGRCRELVHAILRDAPTR